MVFILGIVVFEIRVDVFVLEIFVFWVEELAFISGGGV